MTTLAEIDVVILAGGLGTRVARQLGGTPKVMAPAGDRPFLDHLLRWLAGQGARRVVLCLGHRAEAVLAYLAHAPRHGLEIATVVEPNPLGTAGAIAFARRAFRSDPVLVMNGDTLVELELAQFLASFTKSGASAGLVCAAVDDPARYGQVEIDRAGRVARFREKENAAAGPGWISAGIYLFSGRMLDHVSVIGRGSLERDLFQRLPPGTIHAFRAAGRFIDIGTPETLAAAGAFMTGFALDGARA
jgi:NDP-sugar pyrophosphorylase family protein